MNRQAITFLTLFSLILVLSIYYILLPPENTANQVSLNDQEVSQIEMMQKNLDKEREDLISKNNAIIASSKSNSDEIASALALSLIHILNSMTQSSAYLTNRFPLLSISLSNSLRYIFDNNGLSGPPWDTPVSYTHL